MQNTCFLIDAKQLNELLHAGSGTPSTFGRRYCTFGIKKNIDKGTILNSFN